MRTTHQKPAHKRHSSVSKSALAIEDRFARLEKDLETVKRGARNVEDRLQTEIRKLELAVKRKDRRIEDLEKTNTYLKNRLFGVQSEKKALKEKKKAEKANKENKRNRGQQPNSEGHGRTPKAVANKVDIIVPVVETSCQSCSKEFLVLDATKDSKLIEYHQFLEETTYKRQVAVSQCLCFGKIIKVADLPPKLFPRTEIGNSLWTHFLIGKYLFGTPTNRIQKAISLKGVALPLGTLTSGFKHINSLLTGLYESMLDHCRGANLWNADETTWRVMDAEKRRFWLWVIASDDAAIYILDQSRSAKVPREFFENSSGTLVSDRYSAYKNLGDEIKKAWCWVHVRRDFLSIFKGIKKHKAWATKWLRMIGQLFAANHNRFKLLEFNSQSETAWRNANEAIADLLLKMEEQIKKEIYSKDLEEPQRKVVRSLRRHWQGLILFASDPRIPMDNNRAERLLRGSVILRKNSYGSGTAWSGELSAKLLTLFHTWLINGLNPELMLEAFLAEQSKPARHVNLAEFLPWKMSAERKKQFALPINFKRPA
jgi:transposase